MPWASLRVYIIGQAQSPGRVTKGPCLEQCDHDATDLARTVRALGPWGWGWCLTASPTPGADALTAIPTHSHRTLGPFTQLSLQTPRQSLSFWGSGWSQGGHGGPRAQEPAWPHHPEPDPVPRRLDHTPTAARGAHAVPPTQTRCPCLRRSSSPARPSPPPGGPAPHAASRFRPAASGSVSSGSGLDAASATHEGVRDPQDPPRGPGGARRGRRVRAAPRASSRPPLCTRARGLEGAAAPRAPPHPPASGTPHAG